MNEFTHREVPRLGRRLREEGKVRALGVSIHDRPRAGKLAEESILDLLMIRYNAAHRGAEVEIFPHRWRRCAFSGARSTGSAGGSGRWTPTGRSATLSGGIPLLNLDGASARPPV